MLNRWGGFRFGPHSPLRGDDLDPLASDPGTGTFYALGVRLLEALGDRVYAATGILFLILIGLLGIAGLLIFG